MKIWLARSEDKSRIRLQFDEFDGPWTGWVQREGTISQRDYDRLCRSEDAVEAERIHQEAWLRAKPTPVEA